MLRAFPHTKASKRQICKVQRALSAAISLSWFLQTQRTSSLHRGSSSSFYYIKNTTSINRTSPNSVCYSVRNDLHRCWFNSSSLCAFVCWRELQSRCRVYIIASRMNICMRCSICNQQRTYSSNELKLTLGRSLIQSFPVPVHPAWTGAV